MPDSNDARRGAAAPRSEAGAPDPFAERRRRFAEMVRRNEVLLLRMARRFCGPTHGGEDRAQDLVQEALIRAYESFLEGRYRGRVSAPDAVSDDDRRCERAWLLRILTNVFINEYRRRRWDSGASVEAMTAGGIVGPPALQAAARDTPGVSLWNETLDEPLEKALERLLPPIRLCVVLVDVEGLEYAEAAAVLDIPIGTIRSRLNRARQQLQRYLAAYARDRGLAPAADSTVRSTRRHA